MKTLRLLVPYLLLLVIVDLTAGSVYLLDVQQDLQAQPKPEEAQVGVVFFGDFGESSGLDKDTRQRVDHAAALYGQGVVRHVICAGGTRERERRFGSRSMCAALEAMGIPADALLVEDSSFDTISNWRAVRALIHQQGWTSVVLVSTPLHLYRIERIARDPMLAIYLSPSSNLQRDLVEHPFATWGKVHKEWLAWAAMELLPEDTHRRWVKLWREWTDW